MWPLFRTVILCWFLFPLAGCGVSTDAMVPESLPGIHPHPAESIAVMDVVSKYKEGFFENFPIVTSAEFKDALTKSLTKSGMFRSVTGRGGDLAVYAILKAQIPIDAPKQNFFEARSRIVVESLLSG